MLFRVIDLLFKIKNRLIDRMAQMFVLLLRTYCLNLITIDVAVIAAISPHFLLQSQSYLANTPHCWILIGQL